MAGEVGHVVYGARVLHHLEDKVKDTSFWQGTLFPDIRHLGVVSRHHTHPSDVSLNNLTGTDDFLTGMRVHAWVDATRDKFLRNRNIKEELPWHPFVPHALKLFEDELLYDHFKEWEHVLAALNTIDYNAQSLVEDDLVIERWYEILRDYFSRRPDDDSRIALAKGIGLSHNSALEINSVVQRLANNPKTTQLLHSFWQHLEDILS